MSSGEDLLEIIDENENVLGVAPRREFHDPKRKEKLLHRAAHVIAIDAASGKWWVKRRSSTQDVYPGAWEVAACGHIDPGETPEQGALREVGEELGIRPERIFYLGKYSYGDEIQRQINHLFWFKTTEIPVVNEEADDLKLATPQELQEMAGRNETTPQTKEDLRLAKEKKLFE